MLYAIIAITLIMLTSLSGLFFIWKQAYSIMHRHVHLLVTFSIGVFAVIVYTLFVKTLTPSTNALGVLLVTLLGMVFLEVIGRLIPTAHHHHNTHHHNHTKIDARRLLMSHALRIPIDGFVVTSAFFINIEVGLTAAFGILLHEIVQNVSQFFVMQEAGYSIIRAVLVSMLVSTAIFSGLLVGLFASTNHALIPYFIAFAAGAFLFVIFRDLLPSTVRSIKTKNQLFLHLLVGTLGVLSILSVGALVPEPNTYTPTQPLASVHVLK